MTSTKAFTTERTQAVFEAACAFAGLDATDAKRVRFGENAIYRLADRSAVVRVGRSIPAATKEVLVAGWLAENQFPAATVLDGNEQPFVEDGLPVTFWNCLEEDDTPITPAEFGKLLHDLHALPHPTDFRLPAFSPMPKVEPRLQALKGKLPEADLSGSAARPSLVTHGSAVQPLPATLRSTARPSPATSRSTMQPLPATLRSTARPLSATHRSTTRPSPVLFRRSIGN